jgi:two-component system, chemotaxis family, CheB/CheR fusion protein
MNKISRNQYIIAIGASAGGLEAISAFFDYTPLDAVSYILIQHLSAYFKSHMAQILAPHSKLQIVEVTKDTVVEPNKVYLIPSSKFMAIENGKLKLSDKKDQHPPHLTIDYFFRSLAAERGDRAIGIILSGTGNDGSKGIEAINAAGGMVLVQDSDTASYNGMPLAAIATGCADRVLSPEAMPQVIEEYVKDGVLELLTDHKNDEIKESDLSGIIGLIKGVLPLDFTDYKRPTIIRRINHRMTHHNFSGIDKYYDFLKDNPKEVEALANDFLISVTSFFRDPEAFEIIEKVVIPDIISRKKDGEILKIWVPGCATGEEAYTLAILVKEALEKTKKALDVKIFASDINRAALDTASKGQYKEDIEKSLSKERLAQFFNHNGSVYKVKDEIRKMLIFAQHDLVKNPPYCNIDLISCRNLLIYMNPVLQKKVYSLLHFGLKAEGYLFLGPSENAGILLPDFSEISNKWKILKSNKNGREVRFDTFSSPVIEGLKTTRMEISKKNELPGSLSTVEQVSNQCLLEESGFSGVCTDENLNVIRSFGRPGDYLKNEIFNFNLSELLPDKVVILFKAAAHKALQHNQRMILSGLRLGDSTKGLLTDIIIKPFLIPEKLLVVLFKENKSKITAGSILKTPEVDQLTKSYVNSLEKELAEAKHNLEVAYERIESTNENMQSFNEELLSANEEMQSANEELQSVNEELQTVNKEHQVTNTALSELNDDLNNYFRSNLNGQLFVDRDLLVRKYSPGAVRHINIRDSDIGRPLSNLTTNIKLETLIADIKKVILDGQTVTKEAESADARIYQVMTMPYVRKNDTVPDGAIISFYDITELKNLLKELNISNKSLDHSNQSLLRINDDLNNFVYGASHDLNAPILNIEMVLEMLNDKMDLNDPEVSNLSGMLNKTILNFKEIIKDMAALGTLESEMQNEGHSEDIGLLFGEIIDTLAPKVKQANVIIQSDFQQKKVRFPKKNLRSILLNLMTNAIKFSSADRQPEISITTEAVENYILLKVRDNGIGMEKAKIDYVFQMYQRINKDVEGQGIGLYLVRKIVDASGGKIEVESKKGAGSTFKIFFKN